MGRPLGGLGGGAQTKRQRLTTMEFEKRDGGGAVMRMSADEARICTAALRLYKKSVLGLDHPGFMGAVAAAASECDAAERLCASAVGAGGAALSRAGAGCIATALKMFGLKTPPLDTAILRALDDTIDDMWEALCGREEFEAGGAPAGGGGDAPGAALSADEAGCCSAALDLYHRRLAGLDPDGLTPLAGVAARCGRLAVAPADGLDGDEEAALALEAVESLTCEMAWMSSPCGGPLDGVADGLHRLADKLRGRAERMNGTREAAPCGTR